MDQGRTIPQSSSAQGPRGGSPSGAGEEESRLAWLRVAFAWVAITGQIVISFGGLCQV